jgi:hypothetical protein
VDQASEESLRRRSSSESQGSPQNNCILLMVDKLYKFVVMVPTVKKLTTIECVELFIIHIFQTRGIPERIISDRDKLFTSNFWTEFMNHLQVQINMSTAFHPQTDGQTEKTNSVVEQVLRKLKFRDSISMIIFHPWELY